MNKALQFLPPQAAEDVSDEVETIIDMNEGTVITPEIRLRALRFHDPDGMVISNQYDEPSDITTYILLHEDGENLRLRLYAVETFCSTIFVKLLKETQS